MIDREETNEHLLDLLQERAKELNCLYRIDEILSDESLSLPEMFEQIVAAIPAGFRFPEICQARIVYQNRTYQPADFLRSGISEISNIKVEGSIIGLVEVLYTQDVPPVEDGFFHDKERKLLKTIADRIGQTIMFRHMRQISCDWRASLRDVNADVRAVNPQWKVIVDLLLQTDPDMLVQVCRRMVNRLSARSPKASDGKPALFAAKAHQCFHSGEVNAPGEKMDTKELAQLSEEVFTLASEQMSDLEISVSIQRWIQEEKANSLIKAVDRIDVSIGEIVEAITRYCSMVGRDNQSSFPSERWLEVALIRWFLSDNPDFIRIARAFLKIDDFHDITSRLIYPPGSHGKIGGKATGIFLAQKILHRVSEEIPLLRSVKMPKTWYITTDETREFLQYNDLQGLNEQKYKPLEEVRIDYPNIIQLLKHSRFPPGFVKSLAMAMDDFGEVPLIVRSSSVLEDQVGAAFSGKYKSLFLANQGSKKDRLDAVMDAITEIYASMYGPDSIQYRAERGMLDFHEEMGILIQEVVGTRIGPYFLPSFAGVAFSNNEFRWSPRIKREDGLIRMVMGLGTRAVDRLNDDFPILLSPGQPKLRANTTPDEVKRYSPKQADVINLETNTFESVDINSFLREYGSLVPDIQDLVSVCRDGYLGRTSVIDMDFERDDLVVTFEGLAGNSVFIKTIDKMLQVLKDKLQTPVDIEFAFDGEHFYLLQCRSQSSGVESLPGPIPKDVDRANIVFSAKRHISNGTIADISHIVYVDPDGYNELQHMDDLAAVGRVVGMINAMLPKRRFILMGPGRWGSRGDIKLGVQVSYADINNCAAIIEIAKRKSNYVPELSFGTHFFQDLVEANIRYLPLYPDDEGIVFNERFLTRTPNVLPLLLPDYVRLENVVRIIDVPESVDGKLLQIAMNAEIGEAIGYLAPHVGEQAPPIREILATKTFERTEDLRFDDKFWRWRSYMAERLASRLDPAWFGVRRVYLIGSVNSGTAGPGSDIDLIIHFQGDAEQRERLESWLEGWSIALAEINYLKTGYTSQGLLDAHIVTDDDIAKRTSYALKIDAITDPATPLAVSDPEAE
ncbi:MAG: PEP/pyruvate-binding domain-containing protein [Sedimentisphaerales bacterium]|jgi:predicted nucleotidyltransferase|nr:PEP/pyruvate-binding domain-containing protein [Sedimentisphaerales bacterium]NLT77345.1 pyruvate, phosphate dikinase [Planctomycetota bacterium]